jgi:hypothetical protein
MKRKDYKEVSPEPKDYGDSDYSDDRSPSSWAAAGRDDNDLYIWEEVPKEKTPEGPNDGGNGNDDGDDDGNDGGDPSDDDPFGMHPMCCAACRHSISELYASVDECFQAMEVMRQRMEDLERVVGDDYKFLNRNVRKLFGMVGNFFFSNTHAAYHCIKKKLRYYSVTTQLERTLDGHKLSNQLNTTRTIHSNMNYSHPTQPKQRALGVALSRHSIPQGERSWSCSSTSGVNPALHPSSAAEAPHERACPPLPLPKPTQVEARQSHRVVASVTLLLALPV